MDKLKELFKAKVLSASDEIKGIIKDHGSQIIDHVQIDQIYGGMRGIQSMIWETSSLDAQVGIRFRGLMKLYAKTNDQEKYQQMKKFSG